MTMENPPFESMYFLLKIGIFQCHVSFEGGNLTFANSKVAFFCEVLNDACWETWKYWMIFVGFILPSPKGLNAVAPVG